MVSSQYGLKLNPYAKLREPLGVTGVRQSMAITISPSRTNSCSSAFLNLVFKITLNSEDANRTVVQNLCLGSRYVIDDGSATKALTKKKDMLSELAFSGRHAKQSVWVLTQKYNS